MPPPIARWADQTPRVPKRSGHRLHDLVPDRVAAGPDRRADAHDEIGRARAVSLAHGGHRFRRDLGHGAAPAGVGRPDGPRPPPARAPPPLPPRYYLFRSLCHEEAEVEAPRAARRIAPPPADPVHHLR